MPRAAITLTVEKARFMANLSIAGRRVGMNRAPKLDLIGLRPGEPADDSPGGVREAGVAESPFCLRPGGPAEVEYLPPPALRA